MLQEKKKGKKVVRFNGVNVPPPPPWAKGKGPATASKTKPPPMVPIAPPVETTLLTQPTPPASTSTNPASTSISPLSSSLPSSSKPSSSTTAVQKPESAIYAPQYQYQAPIKDPTFAQALLECMLDTPIQMTIRELLAISPDLCKQFKEMIMPKRVSADVVLVESAIPVQTVESFL